MKVNHEERTGLIVLIDWPQQSKISYKGFDGKKIWPDVESHSIILNNGLAPLKKINEVLYYQKSIQHSRLLFLKFSNYETTPFFSKGIQEKFDFSGYDYGYYNSEYNYYSLIFHEIINGKKVQLKSFLKNLNKNLLFSSTDSITNLEKTRTNLLTKAFDLENDEKFQTIAIYSYNE